MIGWVDCSYLVSILRPIVEVIRYTDTDSPSLGEIYETFDSMLGKVREAIRQKEPSLEFYTNQIQPIIQRVVAFHTPGGGRGRNLQATRCVLGGKSRVKAVTLFLTPPFRLNS